MDSKPMGIALPRLGPNRKWVAIDTDRRMDPISTALSDRGTAVVRVPLGVKPGPRQTQQIQRWVDRVLSRTVEHILWLTPNGLSWLLRDAADLGLDWALLERLRKIRHYTSLRSAMNDLRAHGLLAAGLRAAEPAHAVIAVDHRIRPGRPLAVVLDRFDDVPGRSNTARELVRVAPAPASTRQHQRMIDSVARSIASDRVSTVLFSRAEQAAPLARSASTHGVDLRAWSTDGRLRVAASSPRVAQALREQKFAVHAAPHRAARWDDLIDQIRDQPPAARPGVTPTTTPAPPVPPAHRAPPAPPAPPTRREAAAPTRHAPSTDLAIAS